MKHLVETTEVSSQSGAPALREVRLKLRVTLGPDKGREVDATHRRVSIGTHSENDLVLTDSQVSRHHCEIVVVTDRYIVRDLGSTNGTRVDGTEVLEAVLSPGAVIQVGRSEIVFRPSERWVRIEPSASDRFGDMVGHSRGMRELFGLLEAVAASELSIVVLGETGTGKELAARAVHAASKRGKGPFVVVDCGAISPTLIESELFGHERGAFTGADRARPGALRTADGGTVLLDEIGELSLALQPKLLRALERREVRPLGADAPITIDVRVVAATHRDLADWTRQGKFREDLYFRLAEVVVALPPLRDRKEDIEAISRVVLEHEGFDPDEFLTPGVLGELKAHDWPGNVRELRNYLRRLAVHWSAGMRTPLPVVCLEASPEGGPKVDPSLPLKEARKGWNDPLERQYLLQLLETHEGDLDAASNAAGVHRKSFERLLRQHGLWRPGMGRTR